MNNWNFKNNTTKDAITGYEDVMDKLKEYTKERYLPLDENDRAKMVDEIFNVYREKNIFPIYYYNQKGIAKEIKKCIDKDVDFKVILTGGKSAVFMYDLTFVDSVVPELTLQGLNEIWKLNQNK